jgi:hypothetical protein
MEKPDYMKHGNFSGAHGKKKVVKGGKATQDGGARRSKDAEKDKPCGGCRGL